MSQTVHTGWRAKTPGKCMDCGSDDGWQCDGRGNVLCSCQACTDCGIVDAYGFHEPNCPQLNDEGDQTMKRPCDCTDPGCPCAQQGHSGCTRRFVRIDYDDPHGIYFCELCAEDAMTSGLFDR